MHNGQSLVFDNIETLEQGINLMEQIDDALYANNDHRYFRSGTGKHMRHILDHYLSFLNARNGRINYDTRRRDRRLERERVYAIAAAREIIGRLQAFGADSQHIAAAVQVNSNRGDQRGEGAAWSVSTRQRELQFLLSHTVHHYALIALTLRIQGVEPPESFGVAPSTLRFETAQTSG